MAEVKCKLITCDRCGATRSLKCIGEGEMDGGFTRWDKFEYPPEGWHLHIDVGRLCPKCNKKYEDLIYSFMNNEVITVTTTCKTPTSGYIYASSNTLSGCKYVEED